MARSTAHVLKDTLVVNWKDTGRTIPRDRKIVGIPPRATTPVQICNGHSVPPISIRSQEIEGPMRSIIPQEVRNAEPLNASINIISSKNRDPTPTWSKVRGRKFINESSTDVYVCIRMNIASDTVLRESPNFMDLGLLFVNTTDELRSVFYPTTRIGSSTHGPNWLLCIHCISEATADRVSGIKSKHNYNFKSVFETRRDKVVDQYLGVKIIL